MCVHCTVLKRLYMHVGEKPCVHFLVLFLARSEMSVTYAGKGPFCVHRLWRTEENVPHTDEGLLYSLRVYFASD